VIFAFFYESLQHAVPNETLNNASYEVKIAIVVTVFCQKKVD